MPALCVFGAQWGDEGKGKIIDLLSGDVDIVVRYQGGANAGHTVVVGDEKYVLHLLPSGILHEGKLNIVGGGVALDPIKFLSEIDALIERGFDIGPNRLKISAHAHVIFEHHRRIDQLNERSRGDGRIGTTGRGIGPCYADKSARTGLRVCDLLDPDLCRTRLSAVLAEKNAIIERVYDGEPLDLEEQVQLYVAVGERLKSYVADTGAILRKAHAEGQTLLFEGAQGAMLDIDFGTYPFVTSSSCGVAGAGTGAAFPPSKIERAIGIAKAYCTRVGEGPFPSELDGEVGESLRAAGGEFGATTGRPRRCGWLDAVALRYALEINGAEGWVMTKMDILSGFDEVHVAVAYHAGGERYDAYPAHLPGVEGIEVELSTRPGWKEDISGIRKYEDLPQTARDYVEWVEETVGFPIRMLSVGPEREQVIARGL
ncbi:MAG: adenylosuccinate synthase [Planctomycetota bacterium]|jgi:adenylosuccinate synthase